MTQRGCVLGHKGDGVLTQEKQECLFLAELESDVPHL